MDGKTASVGGESSSGKPEAAPRGVRGAGTKTATSVIFYRERAHLPPSRNWGKRWQARGGFD